MNQLQFIYVLYLDPTATCYVIDKFKNTKSILTHINVGVSSESTITGAAGAKCTAYSASLDRQQAVELALGPSTGLAGFQALILPGATEESAPIPVTTPVASQGTQGYQTPIEDHYDPQENYITLHRRNYLSTGPQVATEDT